MDTPYAVKNVKSFTGMEGYGFNATLYRDGAKVAFVIDSGNGGCMNYRFDDRDAEKAFEAHAAEWCKARHPEITFEQGDMLVAHLVDAYELNRQLRRWCKAQTVFRVVGDEPGAWRTLNIAWSDPRAEVWLLDKYGADAIEEIANKRFA